MKCIVWFRKDLRLTDNPALLEAIRLKADIIPLFILENHNRWQPGGASRWWLHHSLADLNSKLEGKMVFRQGKAASILKELIVESGATAVFWNRRYGPEDIAIDTALKSELQDKGILVKTFNSHLLFEPWEITNNQGKFFQVFTPYWKKCIAQANISKPIPPPPEIQLLDYTKNSLTSLNLLPTQPDWATGLRQTWTPGEAGAQERFDHFLGDLKGYKGNRNRLDREATSHLSPHLAWGEISVRQIWHGIYAHIASNLAIETDALTFLSEIGWREFSYHLLYHVPTLPQQPLKPQFANFPWQENPSAFKKWAQGLTGYPIVDAGMRELWHTGYMHNRVRMIVASFLIKDLLLPWQDGEAWFWDTLVDADLANNSANWQWVAGCGADAAPYFRIFNPVLQGEKFDPEGNYVRRWVPELRLLSNDFIHKPWQTSSIKLKEAGIKLGSTYPEPIINHDKARLRALEIYKSLP
ncbi:cryptochrome/photolyase family protein [Candidatus Odyssella acanthamoebae]|uniref:Deoxyribodipyrimidine photo-lyase n=1 Tax=Candidatus Odyssella acanthamoebae TaxID=91604 RepID=A0A077AV75_9PROT|nr:deoxyribodipyrimidine photo-lyase [Candidatus Paracaedibacter acanthamoebae]AIK97062.1 deoxyribodipyrimidine photolyase [Candidatus Paracaedibacter acanthamoebae]